MSSAESDSLAQRELSQSRRFSLPYWLPRPSVAVLVIALVAVIEVAILGWVQWQNYLGFVPTQADLGDYSQALYTTTHGQGFFYYTTNIPEGSNGSLWSVHFAPILFLAVPIYALAPSPVTLIVLKQLALALGAIPLYGIAKTYFRKDLVPVLFAAAYLISPLLLTTDWNSFDLEPLFPLALLLSLYFFSKGRFWPFVLCWLLALSVIEATATLLALFAVGGLIGTLLSRSPSPYWTAAQQRRPLLFALIIAAVWFAISYAALLYAGPRGGGYGNAYAIRYSILGANSLPDVLPHALMHPGAAGAALQYQLSLKMLFVELLVISTGALWLVGGLRYYLPIAGYLSLALLSNNAAAYSFGVEQPVLILGFLFVGTVEGAVFLSDLIGGFDPARRHEELRARLTDNAKEMADRIRVVQTNQPSHDRLVRRLRRATALLKADQLGSAERELKLLGRELGGVFPNASTSWRRASQKERGTETRDPTGRATRRRLRGFRIQDVNSSQIVAVAILMGCILPSAVLANPLLAKPLGRDPAVRFGYIGPNTEDVALQTVLDLIPPGASVLTTSHLFPQLSNRANAFVVPNEGSLPGNETIATELNQWANQSSFLAIDYLVDPSNAVILRNDTNLSGFGLYASDDGAVLYERGWHAEPTVWAPWQNAMAGGAMGIKKGQGSIVDQFASSLGPAFYHPPGGNKSELLWGGPNDVYLPRGSYTATFNFELIAPNEGSQLLLRVISVPGFVQDNSVLNISGREFRIATVVPSSAPNQVLGNVTVKTSQPMPTPTPMGETVPFKVTSTGFISFPGYELSETMSLFLVSVQIVQTAGYV